MQLERQCISPFIDRHMIKNRLRIVIITILYNSVSDKLRCHLTFLRNYCYVDKARLYESICSCCPK